MGRTPDENIIFLFDYYNEDSKKLQKSFRAAGRDIKAVAIEDDGFLSNDVESVYSAFLGDYSKAKSALSRPRYFNEIQIPRFWEITATGTSAKVMDHSKLRAAIFYREPLHRRFIREVDWMDENGIVRSADLYNKYGVNYARVAFNKKGEKVNKCYYSYEGKEAIVENFVTGDIIINDGDVVKIFRNKTDIVMYYLEKKGYLNKHLIINSLSTPFFVSQRMPRNDMSDVLFWQESKRPDIPGNMQMIFNGDATRVGKVIVQKEASYNKLISLGANAMMTDKVGFVYDYERKNTHGKQALICTNSDNIVHLEEIVKALPDMTFHISAITEMSAKLMAIGKYDNARMYPGVKDEVVADLLKECDYYFDINHENEILSSVERAFLNNLAIFSYNETKHSSVYGAMECTYSEDDYEKLIDNVRACMTDSNMLDEVILKQQAAALSEDAAVYEAIL